MTGSGSDKLAALAAYIPRINQSSKKSTQFYRSIIEPFEHALFDFEDFALRTAPCIWEILKGGTGRDPTLGVTLSRVVDISTFKAYQPARFRFLRHNLDHLFLVVECHN